MQIAIQHPKPGVASPPGAVVALAVIGVMGLYGFTTTLQKSAADRRDSISAVRGDDSVRLASAVAQTPSLIYAVSDIPPPSAPAPRAPTPKPPAPTIAAEPTPVVLTAVTPREAAAAPVIDAPSASAAGVAASAVEPPLPDPAPRP